jgi:hypothetical protein
MAGTSKRQMRNSGAAMNFLLSCILAVACWPVPDSVVETRRSLFCTSVINNPGPQSIAVVRYHGHHSQSGRRRKPKVNLHSHMLIDSAHNILRLRGGRKSMRPEAPSQLRRKMKKKDKRKASRETLRSAIKSEYSAKPVQHEGLGVVHPSRITSSKPISALREDFKVPIKDKKKIAAEFGHYPSKKNFMPKAVRRALRKKDSVKLTKEEEAEDWKRRNVPKQATPVQPPGHTQEHNSGKRKRWRAEDEQVPVEGGDTSIPLEEMEMYLQEAESASAEDAGMDDDNTFGMLRKASKQAKVMKQRSLLSVEGRQARLSSFERNAWPHSKQTHPLVVPERLAAAGFRAEQDLQSADRTILEYTGEVFADWAPADDPFAVAAEALEAAYDATAEAEIQTKRHIVRQLVYVHTLLGNTERAEEWGAQLRSGDDETAQAEARKKRKLAQAGDADDGVQQPSATTGALILGAQDGCVTLPATERLNLPGEQDYVALADVDTWRERREQLQQLRQPSPPPWADFVDAEEDVMRGSEAEKSKAPNNGTTKSADGPAAASMQHRLEAGLLTKPSHDATADQRQSRKMRNDTAFKVKGVELCDNGRTIVFNGTYRLPAPTGKVRFDASTYKGEPYGGVIWTPDMTTCVRTEAHMSPMVTWATDLLSGASADNVSTWAVRVAQQTGRWFVGCAVRPLYPEYGAAVDLCSDGFVLGNHGAVYKVRETAALDESMLKADLRYHELGKFHRESITGECKRQVGAQLYERGIFAFGTDSIIIMTHNRSAQTLNVTIVRATLIEGQHGTGVNGDGVPVGTLEDVVPAFVVQGVPASAVPFINMESPGDGASLLGVEDLMQELHWMLYPEPAQVPAHDLTYDELDASCPTTHVTKRHTKYGQRGKGKPEEAESWLANNRRHMWQSKWYQAGSMAGRSQGDSKPREPIVVKPFSRAKPDEVIAKRLLMERRERLREKP